MRLVQENQIDVYSGLVATQRTIRSINEFGNVNFSAPPSNRPTSISTVSIQQTMTYAHLAPDYLENAITLNPLRGKIAVYQ
ncbi:hypothetical protein JG725_09650 [Brenneria sp. L3-3C-1]|nr:hypothetical protein [Brenneria sp. L3-3C-1]